MNKTFTCTRSLDCNFKVGTISDLLAHLQVHNRIHNYLICINRPCWFCIKKEERYLKGYDKFINKHKVIKTGVIIS